MKKILALVLAIITIASMLAACGDTPDENTTPNNTTPTSPSDDPLVDNTDKESDNTVDEEETLLKKPDVRPRPNDPVGDIGPVSPEIEALLTVARAYVARTTYTQYEDSKLTTTEYWFINEKNSSVDPRLFAPELGTSQRTYYSSCAVFIRDVFLTAWGEELTPSANLTSAQIAKDPQYSYWRYEPTNEETDEEKEAIKNEFLSTLIPGDVISTWKSGSSGHILLYVGNGWAIHSTNYKDLGGGSYDKNNNAPKLEINGAVEYYDITKIFLPEEKYDFWGYKAWCILRPTTYMGDIEITEQTQARMKNLRYIYAEKISSHPIGVTAEIGDEIIYGIYLRNDGKTKSKVEVKDYVPENTTYVSGADAIVGNSMRWSVELDPGESKMICYIVKVNEDQSLYDSGVIVSNDATAGGVYLPCNNVYIAKKLDSEIAGKFESAYEGLSASGITGAELVEAIYKNAGMEIDFDDALNIWVNIFTGTSGNTYKLNQNSAYYGMVAPTLYGGYRSKGNDENKGERNLFIDYTLVAGDILICQESSSIKMYMCIGDGKLIDVYSDTPMIYEGEEYKNIVYSVYGHDTYVVLRPYSV